MSRDWRFPSARILIFAKAPVLGQVKTRLAEEMGAEEATSLYRQLLETMVAKACNSALAPVELWCFPDVHHEFFRYLQGRYAVSLHVQAGVDLGERMSWALQSTLLSAELAILIGSDCPGIDAPYLERALHALHKGDEVVVGPALDGGYVLIGWRGKIRPRIFSGIPWSTPDVLSRSLERLEEEGVAFSLLTPLQDIDRVEDLSALVHQEA